MKFVKFGPTTLEVPAIALGIMRMNKKTPEEASELLTAAHDQGVNYIDSADIYGQGKSEEVFGQALKLSGLSRTDFHIQSKTGIVPGHRYDFSKEHILSAVDGILERMQVDYLDSLLLHRPDALMDVEEVAEAFDLLQQRGKVRFFGVSNFNPSQLSLLQSAVSQRLIIDQVQFSLDHTGMIDEGIFVNRTEDEGEVRSSGLLNYCQEHHLLVQTWSPFQNSQMSASFIDNPFFPKLNRELEKLAQAHHTNKNAIAVAWILRHPAQMQVLIGTMNPKHLLDSCEGAGIKLTRQEWYDLYLAVGHDLP